MKFGANTNKEFGRQKKTFDAKEKRRKNKMRQIIIWTTMVCRLRAILLSNIKVVRFLSASTKPRDFPCCVTLDRVFNR